LSTKVERSQIEWRRSKVAELDSQGHSQAEISRILQVSIGTVNRDLSTLRQQAKENIKRYIDERLPEEYEKCLVGLNAITREAWNTAEQTEDKREKIHALSLAKECYSMKLDLLTNATVVDDAIKFVSSNQKGCQQQILSEEKKEKEKAKAIDCIIEDNSSDIQGSEEENQQYVGAAAATTATTNQTF
jgi:hypothetical protein